MPKILSQCVKTILQTSNQFDHVDDPQELLSGNHRPYSLQELKDQIVASSTNLANRFTLQLCDLMLWYAHFCSKRKDETCL